MKRNVLFAISSAILLALLVGQRLASGQATNAEGPSRAAILAVLTAQQESWNHGDIEGFMNGYWNSPQLTFSGAGGLRRGWEPVRADYRTRYHDAQAMGHLDFSELEVYALGKDAALVLGRWHLQRASDELGGVFTLVFHWFPEGWRIIHDHTSADAKPH